jgi:hypothetical protein
VQQLQQGTLTKGEVMKRWVISAAIIGSAFIFTSCATDNNGQVASNNQQESPYAPPINSAIMNDPGYNHWPLTFSHEYIPGTEAGQ